MAHPHLSRHPVLALANAIVFLGMCVLNIYCVPLYLLTTTYLSIYLALHVRSIGPFATTGDFSYVIYIYAWPVQQTMASLFN